MRSFLNHVDSAVAIIFVSEKSTMVHYRSYGKQDGAVDLD